MGWHLAIVRKDEYTGQCPWEEMEMRIKVVKNSAGLRSHQHVDPVWWDSQRLVTMTAATGAAGNSKHRCIRISVPVSNYWCWKRFMRRCWICETERQDVVLAWIFSQTEHKLLMQASDFARWHNKHTKLLMNHKTVARRFPQSGIFKAGDLASCLFPLDFLYDQDVLSAQHGRLESI